MQLRLISLNLSGLKDWELREHKIVEFLNEVQPDVVLLQEVMFDASVSLYNQAVVLNRLLARPFPYSQTTISKFYQTGSGRLYREGLAVLSSFPIENSEILVLHKQPDDKHSRIVQNIDLSIDGQMVGLSNIHLSNNKYAAEQLAELLGILKSRNETRVIAGDFNISDLQSYAVLYDIDYTTSFDFKEYLSFPLEGKTIDYVLIPKAVTLKSLDTFEGLSDHNALLCIVDMAKT